MPELELLDRFADRRRHLRRQLIKSAELSLRSGEDVYDCIVIDQSAGGVQVDLCEEVDLPDEVVIRFSDEASQLVRRCWSFGTKVGYQFIDPAQALRRRIKDVPPPAREALQAGTEPVAINEHSWIMPAALEIVRVDMDFVYPADRINALLRDELHLTPGNALELGAETMRELSSLRRGFVRELVPEALLCFFGPGWRLFRLA